MSATALSYKQDAVATEAYLQTARSRISLRRHALLVDYHVHDGCNARTWMQLQVSRTCRALDRHRPASTPRAGHAADSCAGNERAALRRGRDRLRADAGCAALPRAQPDVVLHLGRQQLLSAQGRDGGHAARHLRQSAGRRRADLPGDGGPADGQPGRRRHAPSLRGAADQGHDAGRARASRWSIRCSRTAPGSPITSAAQQPTPVTEIQWSRDDALPFPVCISSKFLDSTRKNRRSPMSARSSATSCSRITA